MEEVSAQSELPPQSSWPQSLVLRWAAAAHGDLSQYEFGETLGKGSFGEVRAAKKKGVSTELAVKFLKGFRKCRGRHGR